MPPFGWFGGEPRIPVVRAWSHLGLPVQKPRAETSGTILALLKATREVAMTINRGWTTLVLTIAPWVALYLLYQTML